MIELLGFYIVCPSVTHAGDSANAVFVSKASFSVSSCMVGTRLGKYGSVSYAPHCVRSYAVYPGQI